MQGSISHQPTEKGDAHKHEHKHHSHDHDHDHVHDHDHDHSHDHDHKHSHDHLNKNSNLDPIKKLKWQVVDQFKSRKGRDPTEEELSQLLEHGHTHEHLEHPGLFSLRERMVDRDFEDRAFTVGIGGPVGSGKTALMLHLCRALRDHYSIGAVTNDIFTQEDGEYLIRYGALEKERIRAIETGGCPHAAIREDISANLQACEELTAQFQADLILVESGGDNLAANYSRELADYIIYVIDVSGGDKIPRKGGPGITQADLLIINKIDLAEAVGANLDVMERDAKLMRENGPILFTQMKSGKGVEEVKQHIIDALTACK